MPDTETVSLKLPSGEEVDAIVPSGMSDSDIKYYTRMKRPDLFGAPASAAGPHVTPHDSYLVGDPNEVPTHGVMNTLSEPIEGMLTGLGRVSTPGVIATYTKKFAPNMAAKLSKVPYIGAAMSKAASPDDLLDETMTQGLLGMEGGLLEPDRPPMMRSATVPPLPSAMDATIKLAPEQQSAYTAALDKANEKFTGKAQDYHAKLSESFDEAKRQQLQADAEGAQQTAANRQARAEWEQQMAASKASQEQAAKVEQRRAEIAQAQPRLAESIRQKAQAVRQAERASLNNRWDEMRQRVGTETPIPTQGIEDAIGEAVREDLRGAPGSVKQFKQLLTELTGEGEYTDAGGGELAPKPGNTSPWQTIRTHSIAIGDTLSHGNLPANIYRGLKRVQLATEDALGKAPGAGEDYKALKADERKFRVDFDDLGPIATGEGSPLARLVRAPNAAYATTHILGKASDLLEKALGRWDTTGELSQSVAQARAMAAEAKSLPKVKVLPEPAPFEAKVASSEIPERKMPERPALEKVKRPIPPPPETPKPGPVLRHTARIGGKLVGGALGSAVGHPLVGYGVGSELGSELAERIAAKRRVIPPPPSQ